MLANLKPCNVRNVMSWGVVLGPAILYFRSLLFDAPGVADDGELLVYLIAGAIGGGLMFSMMAILYNIAVRRRQGETSE
tara:strand:- start:117 stop:353 length:237 start_codon:yes stop_codon:yes gene_type:complete